MIAPRWRYCFVTAALIWGYTLVQGASYISPLNTLLSRSFAFNTDVLERVGYFAPTATDSSWLNHQRSWFCCLMQGLNLTLTKVFLERYRYIHTLESSYHCMFQFPTLPAVKNKLASCFHVEYYSLLQYRVMGSLPYLTCITCLKK